MTQVKSEHVITSLRRQLGEAMMKIAMLEAQLLELGQQSEVAESMPLVAEDGTQ